MLFLDPDRLRTVLDLPSGRAPLVAILDSGLDPFAPLPEGTHVEAVRSFVDEDPSVDVLGWGTSWAQLYAGALTGRWVEGGPSEVRFVIAQVVDRRGRGQPAALAQALAWVAKLGVDAVVAPWVGSQPVRAMPRPAAHRAAAVAPVEGPAMPGLRVLAGGRAA
jgi:hypothetical protein